MIPRKLPSAEENNERGNLFGRGDVLKMAADKKFSHPEFLAFQWNAAVVLEYFVEKMDLVGYQEIICSYPIDGLTFISMYEDFPIADLPTRHPLHLLKICAHAERLRQLCFEYLTKKSQNIPEHLDDWNTIHFAHFLAAQKRDLKGAIVSLRFRWSFQKVLSINQTGDLNQTGIEVFCAEADVARIVQEVKELFGKVPRKTAAKQKKPKAPSLVEGGSDKRSGEDGSKKEGGTGMVEAIEGEATLDEAELITEKQAKPVTAMKKRKKTDRAASSKVDKEIKEEAKDSVK